MKWITVIAVLAVAGCSDVPTPERPATVPLAAVWCGGEKGGVWVDCAEVNADHEVACTLYNDYNGSVETAGSYVLRGQERYDGQVHYAPVSTPPDTLEYEWWNGEAIGIDLGLVLLPHGWHDYPFNGDGGKRQLYEFGERVGEEIAYQTILRDLTDETVSAIPSYVEQFGYNPYSPDRPWEPGELQDRSTILRRASEWSVETCYLPCAFEMCGAVLKTPEQQAAVWIGPCERPPGQIMPEARLVIDRNGQTVFDANRIHSSCRQYAKEIGWVREQCDI